MRFITSFILPGALLILMSCGAAAQNSSVENLKSQLRDLDAKEEQLQKRAAQLDEDMKPESLEKFFALNGSTHPEELREQRRRQLEKEKEVVRTQLDQLATSRTRLQASISAAEAAAYRQSASPPDSYAPPAIVTGSGGGESSAAKPKPAQPKRARQRRRTKRRG